MILVTGGAGYIGSHSILEFLKAGKEVVVIDNLCNSSRESLKRIEGIVNKRVNFLHGDITDYKFLANIFKDFSIDSVVHFAGLKAVGESTSNPIKYYDNNVTGTIVLLKAMAKANVKKIVFSSSATVYGEPESVPIVEDFPVGATTNPYGTSKFMVEQILRDICISDPAWSAIVLRYFNPIGAHSSGKIGEAPNGVPNNLLPYIMKVGLGSIEELQIFGKDYETKDGTGIRDYIHVVDLARGHLAALGHNEAGFEAINLGTGKGYSVLEMVHTFEKVSGKDIPYRFVGRRPGDVAECYADPSYAYKVLGWRAEKKLEEMMQDSWRWQTNNPSGYAD